MCSLDDGQQTSFNNINDFAQYFYQVRVDGVTHRDIENTTPKIFEDVTSNSVIQK